MPVRSVRIYNATTEEWEPLGVSQLDLSDANPENLGSADSGVSESASRSDHVHSMPTASDVGAQPADADLTAIAGLSGSSGLLKKTAANTWTLDTASYATTDSPSLTGTPTAPTANSGTNTTQIATTAFVQTAVSNLIDGAPGALDTLNELAAALNDDASYASTITNALALKADLASPTFTGTPAAPTATAGTNTTQVATTAFVKAAVDTAVGTGTITSTNIADGTIVDGDVSASAAIAYSKLSLTGSIVNADISASAAIDQSKISGLTTSLDAKPDLFVASSTPGTLGAGDFWLDTSAAI